MLRSDITTHRLTCELDKHFHDQNCDFQKDLCQNNLPLSRSACEAREDSWIIKIDTRSPNGLNLKLIMETFITLFLRFQTFHKSHL